jgi:Domain of unknown function (DUF4365)
VRFTVLLVGTSCRLCIAPSWATLSHKQQIGCSEPAAPIIRRMAARFPQRPQAHQLEDESETYLRGWIPPGWACDKPQHDYGVDFLVWLSEKGEVTGQRLAVQLKASHTATATDSVVVQLKTSTLLLLRDLLDVVLLVKYVAAEKEAYWLLLKDFTSDPRSGQHTISIRIPTANRISSAPWDTIAQHVKAVHYKKLNANRPGKPT